MIPWTSTFGIFRKVEWCQNYLVLLLLLPVAYGTVLAAKILITHAPCEFTWGYVIKDPHIWNSRPQFVNSLYIFYGAMVPIMVRLVTDEHRHALYSN